MPSEDIEEFARTLVRQVRDAAIRSCYMNLGPEGKGLPAQRWRALGASGNRALIEAVVADCVDEAIFAVLDAIDQDVMNLVFITPSGIRVDLGREGHSELGGWYLGAGGWRDKYSEERVAKFADTDDDD